MHGVGGGDCSIAAENIYLCKRRCRPVFPTKVQTQPTHLTYSYTSVTPGPDSYADVSVKIWNRLTLSIDYQTIKKHVLNMWTLLAEESIP